MPPCHIALPHRGQQSSDLLDKAIDSYDKSIVANNRVKDLYALFKEQNEVPRTVLREMNIERPSPDKVLRLMLSSKNNKIVLVPVEIEK